MIYDDPAAALPRERAARAGVTLMPDRASVLAGAQAVLCLVTADRALEAATQAADANIDDFATRADGILARLV